MEFALVLPILLVVALGIVQVGVIARDQLLVVQAARAGAREAALSADDGAVRASALASSVGLSDAETSVTVTRAGTVGDPVTVRVSYAEDIRVPFVDWLFPSTVTLVADATMRQEFSS